MKPKIKYNVIPKLPPKLETLRNLAYNLCYSWRGEIRELFQRMDSRLWTDCGHNPVIMLNQINQDRLDELSKDQGFLAQLERVTQDFNRYLSQPRIQSMDYSPELPFQIAYFSAEFGLAGSLPIYSGGLGILAGDHIKSASDLNVPVVAVGLLYQEGYFSQYLSSDGWQMETYPVNDFSNLPITLVRDKNGKPLTTSVVFKGETVNILIWRVDVGRVQLYMLDTNLPTNNPEFRRTTAQLYGGDREMRLRQEIILGIGGIRALKVLGIEPTIIHMNEGHSAFTALERINILRRDKGLSFDAAREFVIATTVFTTHTPVPAGNDVFDSELVRAYFEDYAKELGINFRVLLGYGKLDPRDEGEKFGMSTLALRLSSHANGVSRLHGKVSRAMWQKIWHHNPVEDVPIDHITNGIHVPTWISRDIGALFDRYLGPDWAEDPDNTRLWDQVERIPTSELWRSHERCREHLVAFIRSHLVEQKKRRGASPKEVLEASEVLNPNIMTIGFARRFATYKRATLLFSDTDRLDRIINNPEHPVQVIISGKAHPQDNEGKEFIKKIIHIAKQERFRRKIVFLEDYNFHLAHVLVSGCDVWLNTPRRPLEACGTSGMKALANGSLNLSILDGWWDEGYNSSFGWAIGQGEEYNDFNAQDEIEGMELYNILEEDVIPMFYRRSHDDVPRDWVEKMRAGLRYLVPVFNSHRMVQEYMDRYYLPCSRRFNFLSSNDFAGTKELASWRQRLMTGWSDISVIEINADQCRELPVGGYLSVTAKIRLGSLNPDDVTVEAYYGRLDHVGEFAVRDTAAMQVEGMDNGVYMFKGNILNANTGRFGFTVRVLPSKNRLENPFVMGLVTWA
jgi:glycogen phosphorylase